MGLAPPRVLELRTEIDQEEHGYRGQALDQIVQKGLGLGVDPVQVLEHQAERLDPALPDDELLDSVHCPVPSLARLHRLPLGIAHRDVEEGEESGQYRSEAFLEG